MKKKKLTKRCEACSNTFTTTLSYQRYCSPECRNRIAKEASKKARDNFARKQPKPTGTRLMTMREAQLIEVKVCQSCLETFTHGGEKRGWKNAKFCPKCRTDRKAKKGPSRQCIQCTNWFQPCWERKEAKLCSRKCQGLQINAQGLGPRYNDNDLLEKIVAVIKQDERSLSKDELLQETGLSANALNRRKWSMEFLYEKAGRTYEGPVLNSRFEDRVFSVLEDVATGMEIDTDKILPGMHGFKRGDLRADFYIDALKLLVEADGKQHQDGRDNPDQHDYIRANDKRKEDYAAVNGLTLIRIPETLDRRAIKAKLLRGIRRVHPGFRPLNPSNARNPTESTRRMPKHRNVSVHPVKKRGDKGEPLHDIICRGCHSLPSYKHRNTYLCASCWKRFGAIWLHPLALPESEVPVLKEKIMEFIRSKGRYIWQSEVHLNFPTYSIEALKKHNVSVANICREMGLFAPEDDRCTREALERVKNFVLQYKERSGRLPKITEVMKGINIDHETIWTYINYDSLMEELGGRAISDVRYRYPSNEDFLNAAAEVVRKKGQPMAMTDILMEIGLSYPSYLGHFRGVRPEHIHDQAGVPRLSRKRRKP